MLKTYYRSKHIFETDINEIQVSLSKINKVLKYIKQKLYIHCNSNLKQN